jgi:hypothetical protein
MGWLLLLMNLAVVFRERSSTLVRADGDLGTGRMGGYGMLVCQE